jgi:hypothetical protein
MLETELPSIGYEWLFMALGFLYNSIPYSLAALAFTSVVIGLKKGSIEKWTIPVAATILFLSVAQLAFRPADKFIRLSENFGPEGWHGFLDSGEESFFSSDCHFFFFADPLGTNRLDFIGGAAALSKFYVFDALNKRIVLKVADGVGETSTPDSGYAVLVPSPMLRELYKDADLQEARKVELITIRERIEGSYLSSDASNGYAKPTQGFLATAVSNMPRRIFLYFPDYLYDGQTRCSGTVTIGQNLGG